MKLYAFQHDEPVKASCCNWTADTTYWIANNRKEAEHAIQNETPDDRTPHGICGRCMAAYIANQELDIHGDIGRD